MKLNYLILVAALIFYTTTAAQVNAGQIDDFENGTIQNWTDGGSAVPPENMPTGGPAGTNDNYLRDVSLGGNGAGSKMVMFNEQQWAGNYINEGIVAIKFDARAITNNLNLRVAFDGAGGRICTTNAVTVLAGGNWAQVVIPISTTDFTLVAGGSSISQTLADV
ncbi:MAG: hypothetical protein HKN54_11040, partial [Flavobacteriaceae bacterium]|nr:hypothetical protein [Flavobacteriaceae bacterium]